MASFILWTFLLPFTFAATITNPVLWQDYPDLDVFRVGNVFYYSSSTFAYSPGAPVLASYDLVNWTPVTHSVPTLNFGAKYNLNGTSGSAYVKGIWASTLRYRASTDTFIWMGCIESRQTYIWTASGTRAAANNGVVAPSAWNWTAQPPIPKCYYDCGLLIDNDDTLYVAYGNPQIHVAQLSPDGLRQVKDQVVFSADFTIEGSRMYRIKDTYYIFVTRPADAEYVLKSTSGPFGPYTSRVLVNRISGPLTSAGYAHQGGIVDTPSGQFYYVAFLDAYPGGRIPVAAPLTFNAAGWPEVTTDSKGGWAREYPPAVTPASASSSGPQTQNLTGLGGSPILGTDTFSGPTLSHNWEWNHNPDNSKWEFTSGGGLSLRTADVTTDLFSARNTLTQRILGPRSTGTFRVDVSGMRDGDRMGAVLFRDRAAYIGVWKEGSASRIVVVTGLMLTEGTWATSGRGTVAATGPTLVTNGTEGVQDVWLRIDADVTPAFGTSTERTAAFSYSLDGGKNFVKLGPEAKMTNSWRYFTGYRFGVFNHATKALGGEVKVKSFTMELVK